MLAKLTSKNQLTLPKTIVEQVRADYYSVRTDGQSIVLTPVKLGGLEAVQAKLSTLGITNADVAKAVSWARQPKPSASAVTSTRARRSKTK